MIYIKIVALLCVVSVLLAAVAYLIFFLAALLMRDVAITATRTGWTILLFGWWTTSFLVGVRLATALRIFPFSFPR